MTKTNKTLLCALLALVLTLACALTIMPVAGTKANAAENYVLAESITDKDTVVLYCPTVKKELSGFFTGKTPYGQGEDASKGISGSFPFTVMELSTASGKVYSFKNGTQYLAWTSGNSLKMVDDLDDNSKWNVSFESSGNVTITNVATPARTILWNKSATRFAAYTGKEVGNDYYATQFYKLAASHTHAYSEWKHVDGTKTHVKTCNVEGCDAPTVTEACTIVNNVCTVCNYDYTAKFTVKETVVAAEGQTSLAIDAEGQFSVTYNVTANQGINMMQGDLAYNREKLTLVSVEAGNAFGNDESGNNNITVTNDVTLAEQKVVASVVEGKTGVLATVTYKLKAGVTEVVAGDFGMTVKATAGNEYVADGVATVEANTITVVVLKGVTITLNDVVLTYTGASLTVGAGKDVAYTTTHGEDYTGEAVVTWYTVDGEQLTEVKNVGAYQVKVAFPAKDGYAAAEKTANVTVNAKVITVSFAADNGYGRKAFGADGKAV